MSLGQPIPPPPGGSRDLVRLAMWRSSHEDLKRTMAWFLTGMAIAAIAGWVTLEVLPTTRQTSAREIRAIGEQAVTDAFVAEYDDAYAHALTERIAYELVLLALAPEADAASAWVDGVRRGWVEGWNDALDAMRAASLEAGADADSSEMAALDDAVRR